jgi:hypothetical protein
VGSTAIGPLEWLALDRAVHDAIGREAPLDGMVITHGTATLEETAYFLHLSLKVAATVAVVGAQRPATGLSSGRRAQSPERGARGRGARGSRPRRARVLKAGEVLTGPGHGPELVSGIIRPARNAPGSFPV